MGLNMEYIDGQTPIDDDEIENLKIKTISTQEELDEFEQLNIEEAMQWVLSRKFKVGQIFTENFIRELHQRMFGNIWSWAGRFRKTEKNIGVEKHQISTQLKILCDDALFWVENNSFPPQELAIRFKHRLVSIHCFPNGNGRHSRLMADIIIEKIFNEQPFTWGFKNISKPGEVRAAYLKALKQADRNNYQLLLEFSQS